MTVRDGKRRTACRLAAVAAAALVAVGSPAPAHAHPSDLDTLTLDFLLGSDGLRWIDAAVVASDDSFKEIDEQSRRAVALRVVAALDASAASVAINPRLSSRYHEAGFLVSFVEPGLGSKTALHIDTAVLQRIASAAGSRALKVSVCGAGSDPESPAMDALRDIVIQANRPGTLPAGINDRPLCETWRTRASDPPVRITIAARQLPRTGPSGLPAMELALAALAAGIALVSLASRMRRTTVGGSKIRSSDRSSSGR